MSLLALLALACSTAPEPVQPALLDEPTIEIVDQRLVEEDGKVVQVTSFERSGDPPDLAALASTCEGGDQEACHQRGNALLSAGSYAEAEGVWLELCGQGHAMACGDLAYQYDNPYIEMPGQKENAVAVATKACELRAQPVSCYLLAGWYEKGKFGLGVDAEKARELYGAACESGHHWACEKVGS